MMPNLASLVSPGSSSSAGLPASSDTGSQRRVTIDASSHLSRSPTKTRSGSSAARRKASLANPSPSHSPSRVEMPSGVPNFQYKDHSQYPPLARSDLNADEDEEIELGLDDGEEAVSAELQELYTSFQTCIELRDKYIALSCQRLEDNPNNYDGEFAPATGSTSTSASRPASPAKAKNVPLPTVGNDGLPSLEDINQSNGRNASGRREPWTIYPPPPKPHWDPKDPFDAHRSSAVQQQAEFRFEDCKIPEEHPFSFGLDDQGVYQVYENDKVGKYTRHSAAHLP